VVKRAVFVGLLIMLAVGLAVAIVIAVDARRDRDRLQEAVTAQEERIRIACRENAGHLFMMEHHLETEGAELIRRANDLMVYGRPLFNLCGAKVEGFDGFSDPDVPRMLERIRALRAVLEHWRDI